MHKKRAFTLIEIVIALMVFGVGVVVLLRAIIYFVGA
jgi:prepilin-type N-terminal cleavage/methylation domain-containing protein